LETIAKVIPVKYQQNLQGIIPTENNKVSPRLFPHLQSQKASSDSRNKKDFRSNNNNNNNHINYIQENDEQLPHDVYNSARPPLVPTLVLDTTQPNSARSIDTLSTSISAANIPLSVPPSYHHSDNNNNNHIHVQVPKLRVYKGRHVSQSMKNDEHNKRDNISKLVI
jgi:hypothetical protein